MWVITLLAFAVSCTTPNPRSCADGICNDQTLPFCDVDGALGGEANTCIAVDCTPEAFVSCRGDVAITCNATGSDYDLVQCERGCGATGCSSCTASSQCSNPNPICDTGAHTCRGCTSNDECASGLCELAAGTCVPEAMVVYAAPSGGSTGTCTQAAPCSLARAVAVASSNLAEPTLRMLPGTYTSPLEFGGAGKLHVYGVGATLGAGSALSVTSGTMDIRGVTVSPSAVVTCLGTATRPSLTVHDSQLLTSLNLGKCQLVIDTSVITGTNTQFNEATDFQGDRLKWTGTDTTSATTVGFNGQQITVSISNSELRDLQFLFNSSDAAMVRTANFSFNTLITKFDLNNGGGVICGSASATKIGKLENNIVISTAATATDVMTGVSCTTSNNLLFPQTTTQVGNFVGDPQFVNLMAGNLHLKATSPARDAAVASPGLSTTHDYDGTARPQGAQPDIGAFEYKP